MTRIPLPPASPVGDTAPRFALAELPVPMVYAAYRIIRDCNAGFAALFGATRDEIVGRSFARLYPEIGDFIRRGEQWAANLAGQEVYYDERVMARLDGQRFWCRVNGRSLSRGGDPFAEAIYCFEPMNRPAAQPGRALSERQRQILAQVAQGKTNARIAAETGLSRRTVEAHRARLMKAIGVGNAAELVAWFVSSGTADR
ncbi:helix-turn-helix transcriptional regulator [Devosia sp.]|uniref:helix-turn-helix transcriptional regulator n=1 Tax=Devosia sp. TaxID=1871048 RepID=UPI002F0752D2